MPYRPPLVPHETFVADPVDLPVRPPGQQGLSAVARAEVLSVDTVAASFKATTVDGQTLIAEVEVAGEGVVRVRLSQEPDARSRSARVATLVRPGTYPGARISTDSGVVRVVAGALTAEITLDPWSVRFLDETGRVLVAENPGEVDISGRLRTLPF